MQTFLFKILKGEQQQLFYRVFKDTGKPLETFNPNISSCNQFPSCPSAAKLVHFNVLKIVKT